MNSFKARHDLACQQLTEPGSEFELTTLDLGGLSYPAFRHCPKNMVELMAAGRAHGDAIAIVYEGEVWSFDDFYQQADAVASKLQANGIKKGDRVAIAMRNYPEWLSVFLGVLSCGAVAVPINSWGLAKELEYGITDAQARLLFCDQQRFEQVKPYVQEARLPTIVVRGEQGVDSSGGCRFEAWLDSAEPLAEPDLSVDIDGSDLAMIMYSSGTTGAPKGVTWPHRTLAQAIYSFKFFAALVAQTEPEKVADFTAKGYPPANLLAVPLFHFNGLGATALLSLCMGQKLVMMYKWDVDRALELIEQERVTSVRIAPAMALELLDSSQFDRADTSSLFALGSGGSATPSRLHALLEEKCPQVIGSGGYGTTETGLGVSAIIGQAYVTYPASSGLVNPLNEVRICGDDGASLPQGQAGEIFVRSLGTAAATYWRRPEETAEVFVNGWYQTGDIGYLDKDGFLYITDRIKDMVIRGGENIYCIEVENAIYQYPGVAEVAAFGVPHPVLGEELAVAITTTDGVDLVVADLREFLSRRIAGYKVPSHFMILKERLPRGPTGKFLKRELRRRALEQLA